MEAFVFLLCHLLGELGLKLLLLMIDQLPLKVVYSIILLFSECGYNLVLSALLKELAFRHQVRYHVDLLEELIELELLVDL